MTKQTDQKMIQDNTTIIYINTAWKSSEIEKKKVLPKLLLLLLFLIVFICRAILKCKAIFMAILN